MTHRPFDERMKDSREQAGLTQMDVAFAARQQLPEPLWISQTKLHRYESGKIEEDHADVLDLMFLAHLYGTTIDAISPLAAENVAAVKRLIAVDA